MVVHYTLPQIKITVTHDAVEYSLEDYHTLTDVTFIENGISEATIRAVDEKGQTFLNKVDINDKIKIQLRYADKTSTWTTVFSGFVFDLTPTFDELQGEIITISARGTEVALAAMVVGQEYGTESVNSILYTIRDILTDLPLGIIQNWVVKVLNTATSSGYVFNTISIENITTSFRYVYFPYKPALKCLDDMIDLISADKAPNAGAHWIVIPYEDAGESKCEFCLGTVGNHPSPLLDSWPTWWNSDRAGSTIEVKKDMIISSFTKQRSDANYILNYGRVLKPLDLDKWTNNNSGDWGYSGALSIEDDASGIVGYAIKATSTSTVTNNHLYYPSGLNLALNIARFGGKYNVPIVHCWMKINSAFYNNLQPNGDSKLWFELLESISPYKGFYSTQITPTAFGAADTWAEFTFPIGNYWTHALTVSPSWFRGWAQGGTPNWNNINAISVWAFNEFTDESMWTDNLYLSGSVLRGARDDAKIASEKARIKVLVDDIPKDDTLNYGTPGTTDIGILAQLAKAELYRSVTTPIVGSIVIPGKENIWAGQLCHIHFGKTSDGGTCAVCGASGTFNIAKDMRILKVNHRFAPEPHGFRTYLALSDDTKNSRAIDPNMGYALLAKATHPEFQTREISSLRVRDIDITQAILSENYST